MRNKNCTVQAGDGDWFSAWRLRNSPRIFGNIDSKELEAGCLAVSELWSLYLISSRNILVCISPYQMTVNSDCWVQSPIALCVKPLWPSTSDSWMTPGAVSQSEETDSVFAFWFELLCSYWEEVDWGRLIQFDLYVTVIHPSRKGM